VQRRLARVFLAGILSAATTAAIGTMPAQAIANSEEVTASEVSKALDNTTGSLVTADNTTTVKVPAVATEGVELTTPTGKKITVKVPNANKSKRGTKLKSGAVTYGGKHSANAVIASKDKTQFLTVIENRKADTAYSYTVPEGVFQVIPGGGAALTHKDGTPLAIFPTPWAYDAKGQKVATHFVANGDTLTQVVNHKQRNVAYPVIADPVPVWVILAIARCGATGSLAWVLSGGFDWWWRAMAVAGACLKL
jgi:hypothetical protein